MVAQQSVMVSPGSPNTALPITTSAGILNLDHYKYLRSLLPPVPHFIESLSFTDLNNWECQIYVNLVTESDCMKWLADFEEKTSTDWRVDHEASRSLPKVKGCNWQMVYRCVSPDTKKDCTAQLEMRIFSQEEGRPRSGKQHPCEVNINFYHLHATSQSLLSVTESFKSQDIPSHLKEGFEGYFQETMSPVQPGLTTATVELSAVRSGSQGTEGHTPQQVQLQLKAPSIKTGGIVGAGKDQVCNLLEVGAKLDRAFDLLRSMLGGGATGAGAVTHFLDKFDRLRGDRQQLEDALSSFGGQWDWLVTPDTTVGTGVSSVISQGQQDTDDTQSKQSNSPLGSPGRKRHKKIKREPEEVLASSEPLAQQVFNTNIVGGQVVLQTNQPSSGTPDAPDLKRRKRARCGNCSGCVNRDKTQDCRQCRNCLDQKRYGGPGRLKKACIKRQCAVITQMIGGEPSPEQKPVSSSPPVTVKTEPPPPVFVKSEPQETAVTLAARTEANQGHTVTIGGQSVSLLGPGSQTFSSGGHTVSLVGSQPASGAQTFSIGGQTYSLVGSHAPPQTVSIGGQTVSLGGPPVTTNSASATTTTPTTGSSSGTPISASTLLSWPGAQYPPGTFQVQPQQPVQFVFQPAPGFSTSSGQPVQVQYTTQLGTQQLESLVSEASRHHGVG